MIVNWIKTLLKTVFLFLFFVTGIFSETRAQAYRLVAQIDTIAKVATLDNFGNLFVVTPKNEVLKFNADGKFLWNYSNKTYGEITQIDVTDPLRVILYYAAFQQMVVLNNNLSEISKYSFNQNPNQQVTLVASANNNGYWVYDQINRELKKLTNSFIDDLKSGNLYQRNGLDMHANFMLTDNQYLYINDDQKGVRIFDNYGNFVKIAVIYPKQGFEVQNEYIYFVQGQQLMRYNFQNFDLKEIPLPITTHFDNAIMRFNRLIILSEKGLTLWAIKNN